MNSKENWGGFKLMKYRENNGISPKVVHRMGNCTLTHIHVTITVKPQRKAKVTK